MEKVVILARVSTDKQEYQRQITELTEHCRKMDWEVVILTNKPSFVELMQVMPHIARHWDVTAEELLDPAINIDVACRLYKSMLKQLRTPKSADEFDRMAFAVASYNCGASRVIDARNLAEYYDEPKYEWTTVSDYMLLLSDEEFYNHEAVNGGEFKEPHITIAYTNKVLHTYARFKRKELAKVGERG